MYLTEQNVHVFDWTKCNLTKCTCTVVHVFDYNQMCKQNVDVFDKIWFNKMYMYLYCEQNVQYLTVYKYLFDYKQNVHVVDCRQNVHVFDCKQNVQVFVWTTGTCICWTKWLNKMYMYMYLTEQNVHVFDWTKCTCIWLNKVYMYLTVDKMYMYLTITKCTCNWL